jgi:hypothetical protein
MTVKAQYSVTGSGSWSDISTGVAGTAGLSAENTGAPDFEYFDAEPGTVSLSQNLPGLSAGDYDVRFVAVCDQSTRTLTVQTGAALAMEANT